MVLGGGRGRRQKRTATMLQLCPYYSLLLSLLSLLSMSYLCLSCLPMAFLLLNMCCTTCHVCFQSAFMPLFCCMLLEEEGRLCSCLPWEETGSGQAWGVKGGGGGPQHHLLCYMLFSLPNLFSPTISNLHFKRDSDECAILGKPFPCFFPCLFLPCLCPHLSPCLKHHS